MEWSYRPLYCHYFRLQDDTFIFETIWLLNIKHLWKTTAPVPLLVKDSFVNTAISFSVITEPLSQSSLCLLHSNSDTFQPTTLAIVCSVLVCPQSIYFHSPDSPNLRYPLGAGSFMNRSKGYGLSITSNAACGVILLHVVPSAANFCTFVNLFV